MSGTSVRDMRTRVFQTVQDAHLYTYTCIIPVTSVVNSMILTAVVEVGKN